MWHSSFFCSVLCITACTIVTRAANILVFMPLPLKSHFRGFQPLFEELSHRGHNVTVVSSFPLDRPINNYTDIGPFVNKERGLYALKIFTMMLNNRKLIKRILTSMRFNHNNPIKFFLKKY